MIYLTYHLIYKWMTDLNSSWPGSLKIVELLTGPCSGINGLVSSFVKVLQVEFVGVFTFFFSVLPSIVSLGGIFFA